MGSVAAHFKKLLVKEIISVIVVNFKRINVKYIMHCESERVLVQQPAAAFVNIKTHCFGTQEKCSAEICVARNVSAAAP